MVADHGPAHCGQPQCRGVRSSGQHGSAAARRCLASEASARSPAPAPSDPEVLPCPQHEHRSAAPPERPQPAPPPRSACCSVLPAAQAAPAGTVDPALMAPTLNPDFAPYTCWEAGSGIVCTGTSEVSYAEPFGLQCDGQAVWISGVGTSTITRWHTADGRATRTQVSLELPPRRLLPVAHRRGSVVRREGALQQPLHLRRPGRALVPDAHRDGRRSCSDARAPAVRCSSTTPGPSASSPATRTRSPPRADSTTSTTTWAAWTARSATPSPDRPAVRSPGRRAPPPGLLLRGRSRPGAGAGWRRARPEQRGEQRPPRGQGSAARGPPGGAGPRHAARPARVGGRHDGLLDDDRRPDRRRLRRRWQPGGRARRARPRCRLARSWAPRSAAWSTGRRGCAACAGRPRPAPRRAPALPRPDRRSRRWWR